MNLVVFREIQKEWSLEKACEKQGVGAPVLHTILALCCPANPLCFLFAFQVPSMTMLFWG